MATPITNKIMDELALAAKVTGPSGGVLYFRYEEVVEALRNSQYARRFDFEKYDAEYVLTFLSNVGATYVRNACELSDGREAEIIMLNKEKLSRPVVQCGYDYIDLMQHPDLSIDKLL